MRKQLIYRCSWRMPNLKQIAGSDKFAAVPPTGAAIECKQVDQGAKSSQGPACYQFTTALLNISSHNSVTISLIKPLSTDEKSCEAA